tara:strand:- start:835 stop:1377 length:543 start_codon:yes stop_codon:yes gene_type:complete
MSEVYQPAEDSYLLQSIIPKYAKNKFILDMGSGSGILAKTAISSGASSVLAADINPNSISLLKSQKIPSIHSDLFSNITSKFDLIIFNPPYLPEDKREPKSSSLATSGGKEGDEIILDFLKQAPKFLNSKGIILLLTSSHTPKNRILSLLTELNLQHKSITQKKIFFETLEIWEIKHDNG